MVDERHDQPPAIVWQAKTAKRGPVQTNRGWVWIVPDAHSANTVGSLNPAWIGGEGGCGRYGTEEEGKTG